MVEPPSSFFSFFHLVDITILLTILYSCVFFFSSFLFSNVSFFIYLFRIAGSLSLRGRESERHLDPDALLAGALAFFFSFLFLFFLYIYKSSPG